MKKSLFSDNIMSFKFSTISVINWYIMSLKFRLNYINAPLNNYKILI